MAKFEKKAILVNEYGSEVCELVREKISYDFTCMTPEEIENYLGSELYNLFCEENEDGIQKALFEEAMDRAERTV